MIPAGRPLVAPPGSTPVAHDSQFRPGPPSYAESDEGPGARLSIGALARATGIPVETLRTWEARYGFPAPERKPSGHRVYAPSCVVRLRRMAEAIARGHRASTVVAATDAQLATLLDVTRVTSDTRYDGTPPDDEALREHLDAIAAFDGDRLTRLLRDDAARLGTMEFLRVRMSPLIAHVGDAWHAGTLHVRHEHFFTQRVEDVLRELRASFEADASGPLVVFATLPGERHGLGLQMAALVVAMQRCRVLYLGVDTPAIEIADVARDLGARAVAISISVASSGAATHEQLETLRARLPKRVPLVVGGAGATAAADAVAVTPLPDLTALSDWAAGVAA